MTFKYKIIFLSDFHIGSGLSSGAESDAEVLKDDNNLPYLPGRTIKGLLSAALAEIKAVQPKKVNENTFNSIFIKSDSFFSNAEITENENEKSSITAEMSQFLYRNIASTAINESGVAKPQSLRSIEVCIPIVFEGEITNISNEGAELLEMACRWVRNIGMNRNRGLGRCKIERPKLN